MFNKGDKVKYKNYEAEVVTRYDDGYTIKFMRGNSLDYKFCYSNELSVMDGDVHASLFNSAHSSNDTQE